MMDSPVLPQLCRTLGALAVVAVLTSSTGPASADGRPPLPPEAYAACDGKHDGDACSIHIRDMDLKGTCGDVEGNGKLVCRPSGPPPPRPD